VADAFTTFVLTGTDMVGVDNEGKEDVIVREGTSAAPIVSEGVDDNDADEEDDNGIAVQCAS
jgi:hypothetical protein